MSRNAHFIYIFVLFIIVLAAFIIITYIGMSYYKLGIEERFYHPDHLILKPSGTLGHGFGIIGSLLILIGVVFYMARKRFSSFSRIGVLKHWLEFHIFLCSLGPILILFHTSFKFGGLVAISFWSMVAVFLSGIVGRFIYIQIPRTIEGREMSLNEVKDMTNNIGDHIRNLVDLDGKNYEFSTIRSVKAVLSQNKIGRSQQKEVIGLMKRKISLNRKIERLVTMQNLFKYWHVAHLPFAIVMLIIMIIHVGVTIVFGYRWIF